MKSKKKTYISYHYLAHYRLPIFQELMASKEIEYTLISAKKSGNNIKTLNPKLALTDISQGGLRWLFVKNKWFFNQKFLWQKGLLSHLGKNDFDSVIFLGNPYYISTWIASIILKLKNKKVYFWTHGVTSNGKGIKWYFRKLFYSLSDGLLLYGHNAKKVMITNGFPAHKLHVIYNSLDYNKQLKYRSVINSDTIAQTRAELFKYSNLPVIVFVGRLTQHKKLEMLLEASRLLNSQNFKVNILFVGDGTVKTDLERSVKEYNQEEHINFYGACYEEQELSRLISAADLCISPGEVGLTAITSLGYGTPVITHNDFNHQMPEYEAIIPRKNGELFQRDSCEDLARIIKKWCDEHKDIPREHIREQCYEIIDQKYNPKYQAQIINKIVLEG